MPSVKLLHYQPDGMTLKTSTYPGGIINDYESFKFSLTRFGGAGGASFEVSNYKDAPFGLATGDVIKAYLAADNSLVYCGIVATRERDLAGHKQKYSLKSRWDALASVTLDTEAFGTAVDGAPSTVADILAHLHSSYIAPLGGIAWNAAKVTAAATVEQLKQRSTGSLTDLLQTLLMIAGSDGNIYSCGVDETGDFFFLPTPATVVATVDVQANCEGAAEYPTDEPQASAVMNTVAIIGSTMPKNGYKFMKRYISAASIAAHGPARLRPVHAPQVRRKSDAEKFAAGLFAAYSAPGVTIQDLSFHPGPAEAPYVPRPWLGKLHYKDAARGIDVSDWISSIDVTAENELSMSAQVGLGTVSKFDAVFGAASGGADYIERATGSKYAPAILDRIQTPTEREMMLTQYPEATEDGLVYPDAEGDEPHESGEEIPVDGTVDSPFEEGTPEPIQDAMDQLRDRIESSAGLDKFSVLGLWVNPGLQKGVITQSIFHALISNGGDTSAIDAGQNSSQVVLNYAFCTDESGNTVLQSGTLPVQRLSQGQDGIEVWTNRDAHSFDTSGVLFVAISVAVPNTNPQEYRWFPADIGQDRTKCITARVVDTSTTGTVYFVWGHKP